MNLLFGVTMTVGDVVTVGNVVIEVVTAGRMVKAVMAVRNAVNAVVRTVSTVMDNSLASTVGIETTVMTTVTTITSMRFTVLSVGSETEGDTSIMMVAVDTSDTNMAEGAATVETTKIDTEAIVASCGERSKSRSSSKSEHSR